MTTIAYRDVDERTRNLMDDIWASTGLSPSITGRLPGEQMVEVYDRLGDGMYLLDNGQFQLPDGHALRAKYVSRAGRVTEVFRVYELPGDDVTWQAKAVEAVIGMINRRQRRTERQGLGILTPSE